MNSLQNDKGEWVAQEGAPFSPARIKCQYPRLIERLTSLFFQEARIDSAIKEIREAGIMDQYLTLKIINVTPFANDPIHNLVDAVTRRPK